MTEPTLLRITNPRAFMLADFQNFVVKALVTSPLMPDAYAAVMELVEYVDRPILGLFVTREGANFTGLLLAENNPSALSPGCTVLHFYNEGSDESRKLLIQCAIDFARSVGFTKIRGMDINRTPDAFARLFKAAGPATELGTFFEFQLPDEGAQ